MDGSTVHYYALAENVRHPDKGYVEAKVIHSFGRADQLDKAALERLIQSIRRVLDDDGSPAIDVPSRIGDIEIEDSLDLGVTYVARALWDKLGIGEAIKKQVREKKLKAPHEAALLTMTAQRLDRPGSKLACHERWLDRVWLPEAKGLGLYQLYRALDLLAEHIPVCRRAAPKIRHGGPDLRRDARAGGVAMPSKKRSFGTVPICSSSMWISFFTTRRRPGSRRTMKTSPAMSGVD
ncbi:MAG: hypothetical protein OEU92_04795 [Alphaproteobacteria bacterium]|nr:hypothetical protein [Alphaproteobacteria bacterium]